MRRTLAILAVSLATLGAGGVARADGAFRTVLVIDASSSMRRTDPQKLRHVAAELYVDLARTGDELAVVGFDGAARNASTAFTRIDGVAARDVVKKQIRAVGDDGNWTDFTAGLTAARDLLAAAPDAPGDQEMIVFLTDGRCDPDPKGAFATRGKNKKEREQACQDEVLSQIVPSLDRSRVYAIGLSPAAPQAFLQEVGRRTAGKGVVTRKAAQLPVLFADVYGQLLGSRLQQGVARKEATLTVYPGAESLDLILVGKAKQSSALYDPAGQEIPIHNREPASWYFVAHEKYRLFKVKDPAPGAWTLEVLDETPRSYSTLQHFDLALSMVDPPEVLEMGRPGTLRARLATPDGTVPATEFLDQHALWALTRSGKKVERHAMRRGADGVFTVSLTPSEMGDMHVGLGVEPGPDGVLSRQTGFDTTVPVIPALRLAAAPLILGEVKQGDTAEVELSLTGTDVGVEIKLDLDMDSDGADVSPGKISVTPGGERTFPIEITLDDDAAPGTWSAPLVLTPVKPRGFKDRAIRAEVRATVVAMSFWERFGMWFLIGGGVLIGAVLAGGKMTPARFKKRALLYYKDVRDPDLPRQSSYPLGARAKPGFYKPARVRVGPTGPLQKGGVVILTAGSGGTVTATLLSPGAKVFRVYEDEDDDFSSTGEKQEISITEGSFRMSPNARYEIDGSGLVFWFK